MTIRIKNRENIAGGKQLSNKKESCFQATHKKTGEYRLRIRKAPKVDIDKISIVVPRSPVLAYVAGRNLKNIRATAGSGIQRLETAGYKRSFKVRYKLPCGE